LQLLSRPATQKSVFEQLGVETVGLGAPVWLRGEDHCKMVAIPTMENEDAKRPNRERESLVEEQTRIVNQMKAALSRLGTLAFADVQNEAYTEQRVAAGIANEVAM
jgi:transposase